MKQYIFASLAMLALWHTVAIGQVCPPAGTVQQRWNSYQNLVGFPTADDLLPYDLGQNPQWYTLGLAIHIVRYSNGSGGVLETELQQGLQKLTDAFAQAHINFLVARRDTIDNDAYAVSGRSAQDQLASLYNVPNAVNIYFIPQPGEAGVATFSPNQMAWFNLWHPNCERNGQYVIISTESAGTSTVPHEIGHYLDLLHTFDVSLGSGNTYTTGDLVPDTPIAQEVPYDCNSGNPDHKLLAENIMSVITPCRSKFTTIQIRRLRFALVNRRANHLREWIQLTNDVASQNAGGALRISQGSLTQDVPSGQYAGLVNNQSANLKTLNERFSNHGGSGVTQKHHDWNDVASEFRLGRTFTVQPEGHQRARFSALHPVTIRTEFIDGGSGNGHVHQRHFGAVQHCNEHERVVQAVNGSVRSNGQRGKWQER